MGPQSVQNALGLPGWGQRRQIEAIACDGPRSNSPVTSALGGCCSLPRRALLPRRAPASSRRVRLDGVDGPEVTGQLRVGEIAIRHQAVALDAPARAPRVADDERLLRV